MPQHCTICTNRRRKAINAALLRLESYRDIAAEFRVSKDSLARHYHNHLVIDEEPETDEAERTIDQVAEPLDLRALAVNILAEHGLLDDDGAVEEGHEDEAVAPRSAPPEGSRRIAENEKGLEQASQPPSLAELPAQLMTKDDSKNGATGPVAMVIASRGATGTATDVLTKANVENISNSLSTVAVEPRSAAQLYERLLDYWRRPFITLATRELLRQHCSDLTTAEIDAALALGLRRGELKKLMSAYVISSELKAKFDAVTLGQHQGPT